MKESKMSLCEGLLFSNRDLWHLIWPLIVEQLLNITLGMADIVMVSSLGEAAVSGVSLVDAVNVFLIQVFAALGTGGAVVVSQYIGRKDATKASETAKQLIYTVIILSLAIMTLGIISRRHLLPFVFGKVDSDVMAAGQKYFIITMFALPGIALYNACSALFRAEGDSRIAMLISVIINVLNISGNAFFIFSLGWGVEGVALPTLISRFVASVILLVLLYKGKSHGQGASISIKGIFYVKVDFTLIKRILSVGVPNGLENGMFQIGKILVLSIVASFGTSAIAANASAGVITTFQVLPGQAIGLAILTVIGQCMGAGKIAQAEYYAKKLMATAYVSMFFVNVILALNTRTILSFYHLAPETAKLAWCMAVWHGLFAMVFWPMSFTLPCVLRAAGDAAFTMAVSVFSMWTIRVGLCYVFKSTGIFGLMEVTKWPASYGAMGVWMAMMLDWIFRLICFLIRFFHGKWKTKRVI